jgi:integrase
MAAGAGLRWGECLGLRWSDIDLTDGMVHVHRVLIEVSGRVSVKDYGKSAAANRHVPVPRFLADALIEHRTRTGAGPKDMVFVGPDGGHLLRGNFRARIWRPALVRAGLLGQLVRLGDMTFRADWPTKGGGEETRTFGSERSAVAHVATHCHGGLRFHDLRHCYATWLASSGAPVNVVQRIMGHEQVSTTLGIYTHALADDYTTIRDALDSPADYSLTPETDDVPEDDEKGEK